MVVWGTRDRIIPVHHAQATADAVPGSRLELFEESGHFPHADDPQRFTALIEDFVGTTEPAVYDRARTRDRMLSQEG
jgi:pimeloyl-ACP methyl ester carboxylesterase